LTEEELESINAYVLRELGIKDRELRVKVFVGIRKYLENKLDS